MDKKYPGISPSPVERFVRQVSFAEFLFEFKTFNDWVNYAQERFSCLGRPNDAICVDAKGRICRRGLHFMTARDDEGFPVKVYYV
jgi:hypothetical protein